MFELGIYYFVVQEYKFYFEELQIYGKGYLGIWFCVGNDLRNVLLFFRYMIGDRSGMVYIGNK